MLHSIDIPTMARTLLAWRGVAHAWVRVGVSIVRVGVLFECRVPT